MTSPSNSPASATGTGDGRPRRRRGGRGRGGRPAGEQQPAAPAAAGRAGSAVPAPVVVPVGADATVLPTDTTFEALGVPAPLVEVLTASGITAPFPIQVATLPDSLAGRDVLGRGRTGSGKTLAFSLPLVARLAASDSKRQPQAAALADPRADPRAGQPGRRRRRPAGPRARHEDDHDLRRRRPEPAGRRRSPAASTSSSPAPAGSRTSSARVTATSAPIEVTILDEADHMADLGFLPGVKRIMDRTPKVGQRMLFSATLDNGVDVLVKRYLSNPITHSVDPAVAPVSDHDPPRLPRRRRRQGRRSSGAGLGPRAAACCSPAPSTRPRSWPSSSPPPASRPSTCTATSARTPASATSRRSAAATTRVLCATDIAARGIHVDDVALVVHVDPPAEHKAYLHRSGRTARAGAERRRRHHRHARPGRRGAHAGPPGRHHPEVSADQARRPRDHRADRPGRALRRAGPGRRAAAPGQRRRTSSSRRLRAGGSGRGRPRPAAAAARRPRVRRLRPRVRPGAHPRRAGRPRRLVVGRLVQRPLAPGPLTPPPEPASRAPADALHRGRLDGHRVERAQWARCRPPTSEVPHASAHHPVRDRPPHLAPARSSSTAASASAAPTRRPRPGCTASRRAPIRS